MDLFIIWFSVLGILAASFFTGVNIYNLFVKKPFIPAVTDSLIFLLGPVYMTLLYIMWNPQSWEDPVIVDGSLLFHEPVSNYPAILILFAFAIIGYSILRIKMTSHLPPLIIALCIAAMYIGCALSIGWIMQLSPNLFEAYTVIPVEGSLMCLFPLNYIISTIILIRRIVKERPVIPEKIYSRRFLSWCDKILNKSCGLPVLAFILMFPLIGLIISFLTIFGQQPDAVIKAFTDTSDWLFSQKISPPPVYMDGHYLCTVAA
ncbi:MAG: DUF6688 family protein, partial [Bacillota bacterium]